MTDANNVLIVGAGPTGLVAAHELARAGIRCRLVDKNAHRARESRAIAIHPRTVESFALMDSPRIFSPRASGSPSSTCSAATAS